MSVGNLQILVSKLVPGVWVSRIVIFPPTHDLNPKYQRNSGTNQIHYNCKTTKYYHSPKSLQSQSLESSESGPLRWLHRLLRPLRLRKRQSQGARLLTLCRATQGHIDIVLLLFLFCLWWWWADGPYSIHTHF